MTATAIRAEFAIVYVVGAMAIAAGVADTLHGCKRAPVTIVAGNVFMGAI